jgi:hypothetical protein
MKKISLIFAVTLVTQNLFAEKFVERLPVYGIVKPGAITTLLAVNHGMVARVLKDVGDGVQVGSDLLVVIEKETTRTYRVGLKGKVAKLHVTPGAAVTPGMPLVTVLDPKKKKLEVSLSPREAQTIKRRDKVARRGESELFGTVEKVSPLVDPDTGAVVSYIRPQKALAELVGDVVPLDIFGREYDDCKVVPINKIDQYLSDFKLRAMAGKEACLIKR